MALHKIKFQCSNLFFLFSAVLVLFTASCESEPEVEKESDDNYILSFELPNADDEIQVQFNTQEETIKIFVPYGFELPQTIPAIEISQYATLSPEIDAPLSTDTIYTLTITSESGLQRTYTIEIIELENTEKSDKNFIDSFVIIAADTTITGIIDQDENHILFEAIDGVDLSTVQTEIEISENATLTTESNQVTNYDMLQSLEVVAEDGSTRTYTVGSYSGNLLINPTGSNDAAFWNVDFNAGTEIDPEHGLIFYIIAEDGSSGPRIQQDIEFQREYENKYIMFVATMTTEKTVETSITRRPYLWAHQKGDFAYDIKYIMQGDMMHWGNANEWEVAYNTFSLFPETTYVDFQMSQGLRNGDPYDGTKSKYRRVEARIFDSKELADTYIKHIYNK